MQNKAMTVAEHLSELRKRILLIFIVFVITMIGGFLLADPFIHYFKNVEPAAKMDWNVFSPWDAIRIYIQFAMIISFTISFPFILYQIWLFVKPGLMEEEQRATFKYIPMGAILFFVGLTFAYFVVFPMAFYFTELMTNRMGLTQTYGVAQYFSFMFNIILPISIVFEFPVAIMFLTKIRILTPQKLGKLRRYAYLLLLILGAVITPPDVISALIVTLPLILLYEISVFLATVIYRKQLSDESSWLENNSSQV